MKGSYKMSEKNYMELMQTLDDAWNSQDWETFTKRHTHNTVVKWPGGGVPTEGILNHEAEAKEFFKTFPDNKVGNRPYKVFIAQGDWTCSVAKFTGTMKGPMKGADGQVIHPTNKSFEVDFCTVAHWVNGEIAEENLFYDLVGVMKQIGLA
jgi:ketosteroid isomerase-like protein